MLLLLIQLVADPEIDLIQPCDKKHRVMQFGKILESNDICLLQGILGKIFILKITVCKMILFLVCCGIKFRESITVIILCVDDKTGDIIIVQSRHTRVSPLMAD